MKREIPNPFPSDRCFFCGTANDASLGLTFYWDDEKEEASTEYVPEERFAGAGNILHGGIQMGLLDELMAWTCFAYAQGLAVTTDLNVTFLRPVYIDGNSVAITCRVTSKEGPKVRMEASLIAKDGVTCTTATGVFHILSEEKYRKLVGVA